MKRLTLTITDIDEISSIRNNFRGRQPLKQEQIDFLDQFLSQIPTSESILLSKVPLDETIIIECWNIEKVEKELKYWIQLFNNIPGYDFAPYCFIVSQEDCNLLQRNVIAVAINYNPLDLL